MDELVQIFIWREILNYKKVWFDHLNEKWITWREVRSYEKESLLFGEVLLGIHSGPEVFKFLDVVFSFGFVLEFFKDLNSGRGDFLSLFLGTSK